jgi:medium-chain acyl-[acyl-carrier-protein] hydrolase
MKTIWQEEFYIKSYEVDYKNRLKITQLFNYMQEIAGIHADHLHWGYNDLIKDNLIWVLSKVKVHINEYPGWGNSIKIETWPKGVYRLFATRDFIFKNEKDEQIGSATTVWLLLDSSTMRPQKVQSLQTLFPENTEKHGIDETLEKIVYNGEYKAFFDRSVTYNDIDINNHVNNAKYVDWILDCFTIASLDGRQVKSIQINYLSAAKPDEQITLKMGNDIQNTDCFYFEGVNSITGNSVFQSKLELNNL